jgi:hypothetical protein
MCIRNLWRDLMLADLCGWNISWTVLPDLISLLQPTLKRCHLLLASSPSLCCCI